MKFLIFSQRLESVFLASVLSLVALHVTAGNEHFCGSGVSTGDFPGTMIIDVNRTEIGIGSVSPFAGGSGRIVAEAGPIIDGVATLNVKPEQYQISPFIFPYLFSWRTTLKAETSGHGFIRLFPSDGLGSVSLEILLEAKNRLGIVRLKTNFTTEKSLPVKIAGINYDPGGEPLDLETGRAVLVATGKTSPESHIWFRKDDFYARTEVCIHFSTPR